MHRPDLTKPRGGYLPLLAIVVEEEPTSQHRFWLAREYIYYQRWAEALASFGLYFTEPGKRWDVEDAKACLYVAQAHEQLGHPSAEIDRWLFRACAHAPEWPEVWVAAARSFLARAQHPLAYAAAKRAEALAASGYCNHYLCEPAEHDVEIPDLLSASAYYLASTDLAREARDGVAAALARRPDDARLLKNREFIEALPRK